MLPILLALLASPEKVTPAQDLVVVVLDDVGLPDLEATPSPVIDGLAAGGATFRRCYAMPTCSPTRWALLTGTYGFRVGLGKAVRSEGSDPSEYSAPRDVATLATALAGRGFHTAVLGKWHLNSPANGLPTEAARTYGFQTWRAGKLGNIKGGAVDDYGRTLGWDRVDDGELHRSFVYNPRAMKDEAVAWWQETAGRGRRFLLWAHNLAHFPYELPPGGMLPAGNSPLARPRGAYLDGIQAADTLLGRFLAHVDLTTTLVVVVGDNGTPQAVAAAGQDADRVKTTVYEGGVRVPLVLAGAGVDQAAVLEDLVHVVDLAPTVCELLGLEDLAPLFPDGRSAVPALLGGEPLREWVFVHAFKPNGFGTRNQDRKAVRLERFKLVRDGVTGAEELYDLQLDPGEVFDLLHAPLSAEAQAARDEARAVLVGLGEL